MEDQQNRETEAYLARIRKTIADSEQLVEAARLRIAETDRMLENQGLTREQVMNLSFTETQMEAANAELRRRGMDPLEGWQDVQTVEPSDGQIIGTSDGDAELENRQRKFGMMMKPFQI